MSAPRPSRRRSANARLSWALFWGFSALAVGAAAIGARVTGSRTDVGMILLGGVIVVGIAAALMHSILSPLANQSEGRATFADSWGFGGGGFDGGGGDCGGGGGGGC